MATAFGESSPFKPVLREVVSDLERGSASGEANYIGFLDDGEDALLARLHLIQQSTRSIDMQTFIWVNDEAGQLLARALVAAANRGVKVRILIDYVGLVKDASALATVARAVPELEVRVYRPTARTLEKSYGATILYGLTNFKGANQRMHNKVLAVDGAVAITGGRNVENSYFSQSLSINFKDRDVLVVGPVAGQMSAAFSDFWDYRHTVPVTALKDVAGAPADQTFSLLESAVGKRLLRVEEAARQSLLVKRRLVDGLLPARSVEFVSDLPGKNGALFLNGGGHATAHVSRCLKEAESSIWIQSPYAVLGGAGLRYFKGLRRSKPDLRVHLSTNSFGSTDNLVAYVGYIRLRERYVHQLGIRIHEYRPHPEDLRRVLPDFERLRRESRSREGASVREPFVCIHAKSFVFDDAVAFVGSFNLDPRSAHLNTEAGLVIRDPEIAKFLRREIERDCQTENSWTIASRPISSGFIKLQMMAKDVTDMSPVDIAPIESTGAFELRSGMSPVAREHPDFYRHFRDIGIFPGSSGVLSERELYGRLLKISTRALDPLL
ncbi:MAG: phospholipase D family protein [Verrucomicrobiales bacterium]|nr:phospholipase D family protein [Verrucomicrobiales bacterium]